MGGNKEGGMSTKKVVVLGIFLLFLFPFLSYSQPLSPTSEVKTTSESQSKETGSSTSQTSQETSGGEKASSSGANQAPNADPNDQNETLITMTFTNDMTLAQALSNIAEDAGVNIVISPEVTDTITSITFTNTPWEEAIKTMVKAYGYGYEKVGNTIIVAPLDKIIERKKKEMELSQVKEVETRVYKLKYIDAGDALKIVESFLSPRGSAEILEMTYLGGWKFVAAQEKGKLEKGERKEKERKSRSKMLIVTDIKSVLEKVEKVIEKIDKMPKLVLIEANIVEVDWRKLVDLGMMFVTGTDTNPYMDVAYKGDAVRAVLNAVLGAIEAKPFAYESISNSITDSGPLNNGGGFVFRHLTGNQFSVGLRALEDLADANVLSAPKVLTVSNQEAAILVGTKYPIVSIDKEISDGTVSISVDLEYYQDIGIQLSVVPQICDDDYINMIVHPAVVSKIGEVSPGLGDETEGTAVAFPIMDVREAETQVMMKSGDTVVIGGLMKDEEKTSEIGVPVLSDLPILGKLFTRKTKYTLKNDLFIFLTGKIVDPSQPLPEVDVSGYESAQMFLPETPLPEVGTDTNFGSEEVASSVVR